MGVIAALLYFVLPVAAAIGLLYVLFRLFFGNLHKREAAERHQAELRERLQQEFPEPSDIERDLKGELTPEEIEQSIQELKQE